jgi:hypothetical protein
MQMALGFHPGVDQGLRKQQSTTVAARLLIYRLCRALPADRVAQASRHICFGKLTASATENWAKLVKVSSAKPD